MAYQVRCGEKVWTVDIREEPGSVQTIVDGKDRRVDVCRPQEHTYSLIIDGESFEVNLQEREGAYFAFVNGREIVTTRTPACDAGRGACAGGVG